MTGRNTLSVAASDELMKRRRARNRAMLIMLLGVVALFYIITIVRVGH
jgi:predicted nucleic acid-binding Zn ribbon protein